MLPNYFRSFMFVLLILSSMIMSLWSYTFFRKEKIDYHIIAQQHVANTFLLTDFCLSTESRHVRHVSMPEWIAPFQDFPAYHEHFPSSSFFQLAKKRAANPKKH